VRDFMFLESLNEAGGARVTSLPRSEEHQGTREEDEGSWGLPRPAVVCWLPLE
jgi:hypothetical protein